MKALSVDLPFLVKPITQTTDGKDYPKDRSSFVSSYYKSDMRVAADTELANFISKLSDMRDSQQRLSLWETLEEGRGR